MSSATKFSRNLKGSFLSILTSLRNELIKWLTSKMSPKLLPSQYREVIQQHGKQNIHLKNLKTNSIQSLTFRNNISVASIGLNDSWEISPCNRVNIVRL